MDFSENDTDYEKSYCQIRVKSIAKKSFNEKYLDSLSYILF